MKAIRCLDYGAPSALVLDEMDDPSPRAGEVVIETEAAGLGYVDALLVAGRYQVKTPLPFVPGSEVAGRVVALGDGAPEALMEKRVMALSPRGALAGKIALPAMGCVPVPDAMSAEAAAGFIVSYCTALYGFEDCGKLQSGETVLVLGAAGGVGIAAIDIAKAMGAKVIAAASTEEKREAAKKAGADFAIDYTKEDWRKDLEPLTGRRDVDLVYDPVGGDLSETALRCLAPGGRHLVVGFAAGEIPRIPLNLALLKRCSIVGVDWGGHIRANPAANIPLLKTLTAWASEGKIHPEPAASYPLEEAPAVLQRLLDRDSIGKPVIRFRA
ncbi:NADPH:quinone oxidoreductase family protein [Parvibaculum sp.]|mgnify:CR=1 FL=1|uniref:NADPH:quinone oxidoreductase family protein n=1 Tax=Parvibaculum sp. TaxID=2024848 RepID=UPI002FDA030C